MSLGKKISDFIYNIVKGVALINELFPRPCVYVLILTLIFVGTAMVAWSISSVAVVISLGIIIGPLLAVVGLICPNLLFCENRQQVLTVCSIITAISGAFYLAASLV